MPSDLISRIQIALCRNEYMVCACRVIGTCLREALSVHQLRAISHLRTGDMRLQVDASFGASGSCIFTAAGCPW